MEFVSLSTIADNSAICIENLNTDKALKSRLLSMGLKPKSIFNVEHKQKNGSLVLANDNFRIIIDFQVAQNIMVSILLSV